MRHKIRIGPDSNVAFSFTENYIYSLLQNMNADISNVFINFKLKTESVITLDIIL